MIDEAGNPVEETLPPLPDSVASIESPLSDGLQVYRRKRHGDSPDHRRFSFRGPAEVGFVDSSMRIVIPARFAHAGPFVEGLAVAAKDGSCWVEGRFGRLPAPAAKAELTSCGVRVADSVTQPCPHGFIDSTGAFAIPPRFELARDFHLKRAAVRLRSRWTFIDPTGRPITSHTWDEVRDFHDGLAAVREGRHWGYIDLDGEVTIPPRFMIALDFEFGLAPVGEPGNIRFIDKTAAVRIPGAFLQATPHTLGLAHVQTAKDKWAWLDPVGRPVFTYTASL
jgi:hypothetical protein